MKKLVFLLLFFECMYSYSQSYQTIVVEDDREETLREKINREEVEEAAKRIVAQIGIPQNFILKASSEFEHRNNARAEMIRDADGRMRRYVIYDPNFFDEMNLKANSDWAAITILAHEIGHHLNNHSLNNEGSNFEYELLADNWSGFVLRKMGASLKDAQSAIATLVDPKVPSRSHPSKVERLTSIQKGWEKGQKGLDKFTADSDVTSELVLDKYLNEIGGKSSASKIISLKYVEEMIPEQKISSKNKESDYVDMLYGFGKYQYVFSGSDKYLKESMSDGTKYMFQNDTYYYKKENDKEEWNLGCHPYMDNIYHDLRETDIVKNIEPASGSFFNEVLSKKHIDTTVFNLIKTINGFPSYELESNSKNTKEIGNNKYVDVVSNTKRYYNVDTGLLHFVKEIKSETEKRKNKTKYSGVITIETSIENYSLEGDLLIPHKFVVKLSSVKNGIEQPVISQTRIISDFQINPKIEEVMFHLK